MSHKPATESRTMEKLKMHSPDLTQYNIARIQALFPNCVSEAKGEDGCIKLAVDFDQLRQELSDTIVEGPQERYHLNWPGKREALLAANATIDKTLRPCLEESVDFDTTKNLFIEGDNLDALKLLQETYLGKVKVIYIDPPYNTGNDFIYKDDFSEDAGDYFRRSNQVDTEGNRLVANTTANGRFHSDWLSMIYPRLKLARNLLSEDGVIFISIDDNEFHNIRSLCDHVFGEGNFVAVFKWNRTAKAPSLSDSVRTKYEYVVCYKKDKPVRLYGKKSYNAFGPLLHLPNKQAEIFFPERSIKIPSNFQAGIYSEKYKVELLSDITMSADGFNENPIYIKGCFAWAQPKISEYIQAGNHFLVKKSFSTIYYSLNNDGNYIAPSDLISDEECGVKRNTDAKEEMRSIGLDFDYSKPVSLIRYLIGLVRGGLDREAFLVLDFFAGSATTAQAVLEANAEDGGDRRFILVQLAEPIPDEGASGGGSGIPNIAEIAKERIRRTGKNIRDGVVHDDWSRDIGFRVLKVDTSNMASVYYTPDALEKPSLDLFIDNIKPNRTPEDLLFQVMLDWGVDLALPITKQTILGKEVFLVDGNALAACFDAHAGVDEEFVKALAKHQPLRVVFRDAGFKDSAVKINVEQIFKQLSPSTEVKCL